MTASSRLTATYERYLRLYPTRWRGRNGSALIGTMLEVAEAEHRERASARDRYDLIVGALDARTKFWDPQGRLAEVALGFGLGGGIAYLVSSWDPNNRGDVGSFANPTFIAVALWLAAYLASLARRPAVARWCILIAVLAHCAIEIVSLAAPVRWLGPSLSATALFVVVGLIAAARPVHRRTTVTTAALIPGLLIAAISAGVRLATS